MRAYALGMRSVVVSMVFVGAAVLPGAAELLSSASVPDGYELVGGPAAEIGFDEFASESPYSVGHVESGDGITAALDVWALGETDVLLREMSEWPDAEVAAGFVDEIIAYADELGLAEATAPFEGASAFSGPDDESGVWVRMVVWSDDRVGVLVNHFSSDAATDPGSGDVDATANALASQVAAATAAASPNDPLADGGGGASTGDSPSSGGGIPITTVLLWIAIIGGGIWLFVKLRRKMKAMSGTPRSAPPTESTADDEDRDVDDIIERARARSRAQEEIDAIPDPADEWTPPDDY